MYYIVFYEEDGEWLHSGVFDEKKDAKDFASDYENTLVFYRKLKEDF